MYAIRSYYEYPNGLAELRDTLQFMTQLANTHTTRRFGAADSGPEDAPATAAPDARDEPDEPAGDTVVTANYEVGVAADFGRNNFV